MNRVAFYAAELVALLAEPPTAVPASAPVPDPLPPPPPPALSLGAGEAIPEAPRHEIADRPRMQPANLRPPGKPTLPDDPLLRWLDRGITREGLERSMVLLADTARAAAGPPVEPAPRGERTVPAGDAAPGPDRFAWAAVEPGGGGETP